MNAFVCSSFSEAFQGVRAVISMMQIWRFSSSENVFICRDLGKPVVDILWRNSSSENVFICRDFGRLKITSPFFWTHCSISYLI